MRDAAARAHIRRETIVNVAVTIVIAPLLYLAMHGSARAFPTWGWNGLVVELVTQAASVAAFGSAIPSYMTWRKVRAGRLASIEQLTAPGKILRDAVWLACVAGSLVAVVGSGLLLLVRVSWVEPTAVIVIKSMLGGMIAAAITPPALRRTLGCRGRV